MEYVRLVSTVKPHLGSDQKTRGDTEEKEEAEVVGSHDQEEAALHWQSVLLWKSGSNLRTLFWQGGIASSRKNSNYKAENNVVIRCRCQFLIITVKV